MTMFVRRTILAIVVAYALAFVALPAWNRSRQQLLLQNWRACEQEWWAAEKAMSIDPSLDNNDWRHAIERKCSRLR